MYRGSGFIMQYRATIFHNVINDFLNTLSTEDINKIYTKDRLKNNEEFLNKIALIINNNLKQFYNANAINKGNKVKNDNVGSLLITKIILGVFCLTPAFDRKVENFIKNIKQDRSNNYLKTISNIDLLIIINDTCLENNELKPLLIKHCPCFCNSTEKYPIVRALDLALWQ